jgi:hypothetical protein
MLLDRERSPVPEQSFDFPPLSPSALECQNDNDMHIGT